MKHRCPLCNHVENFSRLDRWEEPLWENPETEKVLNGRVPDELEEYRYGNAKSKKKLQPSSKG